MLYKIIRKNLSKASAIYSQPHLSQKVKDADPEIYELIIQEITRQKQNLNLIASENYTSLAIMQCLGTPTQNKYSEGFPGRRVYTGTQVIDKIENMAKQRALDLYNLDPEIWDVDVQCLSGSVANAVAYSSVLEVGDRVLGMHLSDGGHFSHGLKVDDLPVSHTAKMYHWDHYGIDDQGWLDYAQMEEVSAFLTRRKLEASSPN